MDFKKFEIQNGTHCECGYNFTLRDITGLQRINQPGFYANIVKHYSDTQCPKCKRKAILLLKQKGQTWEILNIATPKSKVVETPKKKIEQSVNTTEGFICPECKKVCKSKIGLTAHMKTHQK